MNEEMNSRVVEGIVVPPSAVLVPERGNRYGCVPGLEDDELSDPVELERQVFLEEFAPILALPQRGANHVIRLAIDESGVVDRGAFGTVDFERLHGSFNKARYKADKLKEELRRVLILLSIDNDRIPGKAKYQVLKYLRMGVIDLDHIEDWDMWLLARRFLQARRLRREIRAVERAAWGRRQGCRGV